MMKVHAVLGMTCLVLVVFLFPVGQGGTASATTLTTLYSFSGGADGGEPEVGLVEGSDGNFYGTTQYGGITNSVVWYGYGTVFKISASGGLTTLHQFSGADGAYPMAALVEGADGYFYGTTVGGGTSANNCTAGGGCGTVFRISPSGNFTSLYSFSGWGDGALPYAGLVQGIDGDFYSTTRDGGVTNIVVAWCAPGVTNCIGGGAPNCLGGYSLGGFGTVFKISATGELTTLHKFDSACVDPYFWGLSFTCPENPHPNATLVQGSDGSFYGATLGSMSGDSCAAYGSLFTITATGTLTTLPTPALFGPTGLIQASDGNFYGTTTGGGGWSTNCGGGCGTVFKMTPTGAFTTLYSFTGGADGGGPTAGLIQGNDGKFYGTASAGGTHVEGNYGGTVFQITPAGTLTTLYEVGGGPFGGLVQGSDGNFYGTTMYGGTHGAGSVFKLFNVNCSFSINPTDETFTPAGGFGSISVITSNGCIWTATNTDSFITITSGGSGSGNGSVNYTVAANTGTAARTGTMTIAGNTFTVTQAAFTCSFTLNTTSGSFGSAGGSSNVNVTANGANCTWTAVSNDAFITITSGSGGSGNGTVSYTVAANTSNCIARSGTITVGGHTFTVNQAAGSGSYGLSAVSTNVAARAGSGSVGVRAGNGCAWTAVSSTNWLHTSSSGTGNGTVSYIVDANTGNCVARSGTITIAGHTFTVNQAADERCTSTLSATNVTFAAKGGSKTVSVKVKGTGCSWTAVSNDPFITITSGSSGTGKGKVHYSVPGNTNSVPLTGTMTIAGQTFTVNQVAGGCTFSLSPKSGKFKASGGSKTVKVKPGLSDCSWTAVSNDPFITITDGANGVGKGTVSYTVAANTNTIALTGSITIAGKTFTITQAGAK